VAALFQPARRRIQQVVDGRFNRRKYNTVQTIQAFSARLRDQVDLDTLSGPFCKFVRGGHAACASCSWSSKRRSSRSRSDRVKCQSNGVAVCW
jgi:hypothetical protein